MPCPIISPLVAPPPQGQCSFAEANSGCRERSSPRLQQQETPCCSWHAPVWLRPLRQYYLNRNHLIQWFPVLLKHGDHVSSVRGWGKNRKCFLWEKWGFCFIRVAREGGCGSPRPCQRPAQPPYHEVKKNTWVSTAPQSLHQWWVNWSNCYEGSPVTTTNAFQIHHYFGNFIVSCPRVGLELFLWHKKEYIWACDIKA